ncbi:MAG: hypothetical protein WAM78_00685 [Candidatus Sulfotelmatobacter sp.]
MHIHPNQINPNTQLDALYASQRTAAKREAANTRKKLLEFAESTGESDSEEACVVTLESREESQGQPKQKRREGRTKNDDRQSNDADSVISDWA